MILDRQKRMNTAEIRARLTAAKRSLGLNGDEEADDGVDLITDFINQMQIYEGAMYELSTKLEILDSELRCSSRIIRSTTSNAD